MASIHLGVLDFDLVSSLEPLHFPVQLGPGQDFVPRRLLHFGRGEEPQQCQQSQQGRLGAGRFGLGPRPAQTVFEYAGMLGEAMPAQRPELSMVANAKVEVASGGEEPPPERTEPRK